MLSLSKHEGDAFQERNTNPAASSFARISPACAASRASMVRPRSADFAGMSVIMRLCETSRMLPPASPTSVAILREQAGAILDLHHERKNAALARQLAQDDVRQQPHVDIAAGKHDADFLAREKFRVRRHRRIGRGARAFDHRLFDLQQRGDGAFDLVLAHQQNVFHQCVDDLARERARLLHRDAFGDGLACAGQVAALFTASYIEG